MPSTLAWRIFSLLAILTNSIECAASASISEDDQNFKNQFTACIQGRVQLYFPEDPEFHNASRLHNKRVSHMVKPVVVVNATKEDEVVAGVRCAAEFGKSVNAASGKGSYEAYCTKGCVLILITFMKEYEVVDAQKRIVRAEPGLTNGQMYTALYQKGFTLPSGTISTVGLGGIALGGGKGRLTRMAGLLIDHIVGIDFVLYNGTKIHANQTDHADLLWLCKGGGGLQIPGVVTAFYFKVLAAPPVVTTFKWSWNMSQAKEVFAHWQSQLLMSSERRLHARLEINIFGTGVIDISATVMGKGKTFTQALMQPTLQALGKPIECNTATCEDTLIERTFLDAAMWDSGVDNVADFTRSLPPFVGFNHEFSTSYKHRALVMPLLDEDGSNTLLKWCSDFGNNFPTNFYIQIDPSNGAAHEVAPDATPYPWRTNDTVMTLQTVVSWNGSQSRNNLTLEEHSYNMIASLMPMAGNRSYVNYEDRDMPRKVVAEEAYFGQNLQRLCRVHNRYMTGPCAGESPPSSCNDWILDPGMCRDTIVV